MIIMTLKISNVSGKFDKSIIHITQLGDIIQDMQMLIIHSLIDIILSIRSILNSFINMEILLSILITRIKGNFVNELGLFTIS